jgi:hypothetical protein
MYANQLVDKFVEKYPGDPTIGLIAGAFRGKCPNVPHQIDWVNHTEMNYPLSETQKTEIIQSMAEMYKVMQLKVNLTDPTTRTVKEYPVSDFLRPDEPRLWVILHNKVQMLKMLNIPERYKTMLDGTKLALFQFVQALYKEATKRAGYEKLKSLIPEEMEQKVQELMSKHATPGFGMTSETATNMMQSMASPEMSATMSKIFSSPDALSQTLTSMGEMMGGSGNEMGQVASTLQTMLQNPGMGNMFPQQSSASTAPQGSSSSSSSS